MDISRKSAETMLDLVEIKLSMMQVNDREDARELKTLRACREELIRLVQNPGSYMESPIKDVVQKI